MKSWSSKLASRWQALPTFHSTGDVFLFVRIFLFAAIVPLLMRLALPRLQSLLASKTTSVSSKPDKVQQITDYVEAVIRLGQPLIRNSCLTRGLTRYYFLSRGGLSVALCFGMGQVKETFAGHCWLVKNGEPFMEKQDPRPLFKIIYCFPGKTEAP